MGEFSQSRRYLHDEGQSWVDTRAVCSLQLLQYVNHVGQHVFAFIAIAHHSVMVHIPTHIALVDYSCSLTQILAVLDASIG